MRLEQAGKMTYDSDSPDGVTMEKLDYARVQSTKYIEAWRKDPSPENTSAKELACAVADDTVKQWIRQGCKPLSVRDRSIREMQEEQRIWSQHNFGHLPADPLDPLLGMVEELGELAHSVLKKKQGIRGTPAEHDANAKDAVADFFVFAMDFCNKNGWDLQSVIETTWNEVRKRDWKRFPKNGKSE